MIGVACSLTLLFGVCTLRVGWAWRKAREFPAIEVWLGQPVETLRGWEWSRHSDSRRFDFAGTSEPAHVTLHLANGRSLTRLVRGVYLSQANGRIVDVSIHPVPELSAPRNSYFVPFQGAVAEAERLAHELQIHEMPRISGKLAEWKRQTPRSGTFAPDFLVYSDLSGQPDVSVEFQIKCFGDDHDWHLSVSFNDRSQYDF